MEVKKSFYTRATHPFEIRHFDPVVCNLCGSANYTLLGTELSFEIRECTACNLIYVSPQPALREIPGFYKGMRDERSVEVFLRPGAVERHLKRIIRRTCAEGARFLEIGCGYGGLLNALQDLPLNLCGVEVNTEAARQARRNASAASIVQAQFEYPPLRQSSFDYVTMVAVLEHLKDPKRALQDVWSLLKPGGCVLIQVPYIGPFLKLKHWAPFLPIYFEAPRHLFDFSPNTMRRFLIECEFQDVHIEIARPYSAAGPLGLALIWGVKFVGLLLYTLTAGAYIYPFAAAIVASARKPARATTASHG